jgi:hypothetical protein
MYLGKIQRWRAFGAVSAVVLYAISINGPAYDLTTPVSMPHHVLLRKIYAVLAFALLGFLFERSSLRRAHGVVAAGIAIGIYSYAIELGQIFIDHANETFAEHGFDVASGLAGGALGAFIALLISAPRMRGRRTESALLAIVFLVLAWGFTVTYGRRD